jgi:hypothetical protein
MFRRPTLRARFGRRPGTGAARSRSVRPKAASFLALGRPNFGAMSAYATSVRKGAAMGINALDGSNRAIYSGPAGRAALNDLRGWPFPCLEAI